MPADFSYKPYFSMELQLLECYYTINFESLKSLFAIFRIFLVIMTIWFVSCHIVYTIGQVNNFVTFSQCFFTSVSFASAFLTDVFILLFGKQIEILYGDIIENPIFLPKNAEEVIISNNVLSFYNWLKYTVLFCLSLSVFLTLCCSFDQEHNLPFPIWYPYDVSGTLLYSISMIYQWITIVHTAFTYTIAQLMYAGLIMFLCLQYDLLCYNFENVKEYWVPLENMVKWHRQTLW